MPTRIIREGINSSPRINALSPMAELFYRRLMTVADDYGRYYAAPATLRGALWPTCPEKVKEGQILEWLSECTSGDNPLISIYESNSCRYLSIENFGQQTRSKSKFPEPLNKCLASDLQVLPPSRSRSRISESETKSNAAASAASWFDREFWPIWPVKENREDAKDAAKKITVTDRPLVIAGVNAQSDRIKSQERPIHASTWMNKRRWEDQMHQPQQTLLQPQGEAYRPYVDPFKEILEATNGKK